MKIFREAPGHLRIMATEAEVAAVLAATTHTIADLHEVLEEQAVPEAAGLIMLRKLVEPMMEVYEQGEGVYADELGMILRMAKDFVEKHDKKVTKEDVDEMLKGWFGGGKSGDSTVE